MHKFLKVTLASAILGIGTMGVVANLMTKEVKAVEIITHWVPHEVYGQIGEPDNNGKVFFSGLGAKYMGYPKDSGAPPYPGKYSKFWKTLPAYRYYIPD
ncbi:MAG: hydrazine oxidoreductase HzoA, partial [Planctomycetes bacterium]|nr:hydrazine oxidoreductase HzoA [Planctomycetota bacterium]